MRVSPLTPRQRAATLLGLVLAWPAIVNGIPFFFSDTTAYIRSADAIVFSATHHATAWSDVITRPASGSSTEPAPRLARGSSFDKNVILGRSIYYGLFLYLGVATGVLLLPVLAQALLAGAAILGAARHVSDPARERRRFGRITAAAFAAAAVSALPYFTSFLMPDLFAGLAILAAAVLLGDWQEERTSWRWFWSALLVAAALVHSSHVLLLLVLGLGALAVKLVRRHWLHWAPIAILLAAAVIGILGDAVFGLAVEKALHRPAVRPPFVAMRLIADGPGAAYLRAACPASGFALCAYKDRPQGSSDVLLWSADPRLGIFTTASAGDQQRIAREQGRFALAVLARYPGWTIATLAGNAMRQLGHVGLEEFGRPVLADPEVAARMPPSVRAAIAASPAEHGALPTGFYRRLIWPVTLLALAVLLVAALRSRKHRVVVPVATILAGVVANGILCGALSITADRYQDRVIWLVLVGAILWGRPAFEAVRPGRASG